MFFIVLLNYKYAVTLRIYRKPGIFGTKRESPFLTEIMFKLKHVR